MEVADTEILRRKLGRYACVAQADVFPPKSTSGVLRERGGKLFVDDYEIHSGDTIAIERRRKTPLIYNVRLS